MLKLGIRNEFMKRVLVVDDEEGIQEIVQSCLEILHGWEVYLAGSGMEALDKAEVHQPDVILLDVSMPHVDGFTTLQQLREGPITRRIPVILLTAKVHPLEHEELEKFDISGLIAKPFDPLKLAEQIMAILP